MAAQCAIATRQARLRESSNQQIKELANSNSHYENDDRYFKEDEFN